MKLYHASDFDIAKPDEIEHRRISNYDITGNNALGLFCNTYAEDGWDVFGDKLYSFTIADTAKQLEVPDDIKQAGRCSAYYFGVKDALTLLGYDLITVTDDDYIHAVILNFDVIENWKRAE